ncbi:hypothetical protein [Sulfurimonas sp.]
MDVVVLVKSIVGLMIVLGILIFVLFYTPSKRKKKKEKSIQKNVKKRPEMDFTRLLAIIKNKKSSTQELEEALDLIIKYHGKIHPKLGIRAHPEFDIYADILFRICRHPNTTKELIINFDRSLEKLNPDYNKEINDALTKGLNSRGF